MVNNAEQYVALYEAIAFAIRKKSRLYSYFLVGDKNI